MGEDKNIRIFEKIDFPEPLKNENFLKKIGKNLNWEIWKDRFFQGIEKFKLSLRNFFG